MENCQDEIKTVIFLVTKCVTFAQYQWGSDQGGMNKLHNQGRGKAQKACTRGQRKCSSREGGMNKTHIHFIQIHTHFFMYIEN